MPGPRCRNGIIGWWWSKPEEIAVLQERGGLGAGGSRVYTLPLISRAKAVSKRPSARSSRRLMPLPDIEGRAWGARPTCTNPPHRCQ